MEFHGEKDCPEKGDLKYDNYQDSTSHQTQACNLWKVANSKPVHPYLKRATHTGNRVEVERYEEFHGHHHEDSVVIFSEDDTGVDPPTEHTGCNVQVEAGMVSEPHPTVAGEKIRDQDKKVPQHLCSRC